MATIAEKIADKQQKIISLRDQLAEKSVDVDADESLLAQVEELSDSIESENKALEVLLKAEKALAFEAKEKQVNNTPAIIKSAHRKEGSVDLLVSAAAATLEAHIKRVPVDAIIAERYAGDVERVKAVVDHTKAAQNPALTSVAAWAGALVRDSYGEFMELLQPESVVPRLPLARYSFDGYNSIKVARRDATPNLAAAFRAEGAPIRVGAAGLSSVTLTPKSMGVIGHFSNELFERSTPNILAEIRRWMLEDTAVALDTAFLSATAGTATVPAGLQTYATGGNTAAAAGTGTAANIMTDLRGRLAAMTGANLGRRPVIVMHPSRAVGVATALNGVGTLAYPEMANGLLMGYPVVTSTTVPATIVFIIDAAEVAFAGNAPKFMGTDVATIHEENATPLPITDAAGTAAAPVRSLFQTNSAALRAVWEVDWTVLRSSAVQTVTGAAY